MSKRLDYWRKRLLRGRGHPDTARSAGISPGHLSLVLSGKRTPSLDVAARLSDSLGLRLHTFYRLFTSLRNGRPIPKA